jgi:UBX domain-containing protein 1
VNEEKGEFKFTLWKNGITMGEPVHETVPLPYDSPDGKEIMAAVESGRLPVKFLPAELQKKAAAGDMNVGVEDRRGNEGPEGTFKPPPPGPFSGAGGSLAGGGAPAAAAAVVQDSAGMPPPALAAGAPSTAIQVRLANGQKLVVKLNLTHTVGDLQRVAAGAHATGGRPFVLKGGFPPKALEAPAATIEAAGLAGASVTQTAL